MQQNDVPQVQHLLLLPVRGIPAQAQPLRTLLRQNHYVLQPTIPGEATFSLTRALFSPISLENMQTKVDVRQAFLTFSKNSSPKNSMAQKTQRFFRPKLNEPVAPEFQKSIYFQHFCCK